MINNNIDRDEIIESIYHAAVNTEGWIDFLSTVSKTRESIWGLVCLENTGCKIPSQRISYKIPSQFNQEYTDHYHDYDIWADALLNKAPSGFFLADHSCVPRKVYKKSKIYNALHRYYDMRYACGAWWQIDQAHKLRISFMRAQSQGQFEKRDLNWLNSFARHIKLALSLGQWQFVEKPDGPNSTLSLASESRCAAMVDFEGRILASSESFQAVLTRSTHLYESKNCLRLTDTRSNDMFKTALLDIKHHFSELPYTIQINIPPDKQASIYCLSITPLKSFIHPHSYVMENVALVNLQFKNTSVDHLKNNYKFEFNLTDTEISVGLLLADGLNSRQIAQQRKKSEHTIRSQIKSLQNKLGVHTQAGVVGKLLL